MVQLLNHLLGHTSAQQRPRKRALARATAAAFLLLVSIMAATPGMPLVHAGCVAGGLLVLTLLVAFECKVRGLLATLKASVLTRPATRVTFIDRAPALLLVAAIIRALRNAVRASVNASSRLLNSLHVVHVAVLPARVSTALSAPRLVPGAGA